VNLQPLLFDETELPSTSSTEDSLARDSVRQAAVEALRTNARHYGSTCPVWLTTWMSNTFSWKTSQSCFLDQPTSQAHGLAEYSGTWPRSGLMRSGTAFQLAPLTQITSEIASGSLPTPTAQGAQISKQRRRKQRSKKVGEDAPLYHADDHGSRLPRGLQTGAIREDARAISAWLGFALASAAPFPREYRTCAPVLGRGEDGIPNRMDRVHAIGNAVVPQIPELIGRAILASRLKAPSGSDTVTEES